MTEVDGIDVRLEDPGLGIPHFEEEGDERLSRLPSPRASGVEEQRSRQLLGDGAAALAQLTPPEIDVKGPPHGEQIDPRMGPEPPVLGHEHGVDNRPRNPVEGHPGLRPVRRVDRRDGSAARRELAIRVELNGRHPWPAGVGKRVVPGDRHESEDHGDPGEEHGQPCAAEGSERRRTSDGNRLDTHRWSLQWTEHGVCQVFDHPQPRLSSRASWSCH